MLINSYSPEPARIYSLDPGNYWRVDFYFNGTHGILEGYHSIYIRRLLNETKEEIVQRIEKDAVFGKKFEIVGIKEITIPSNNPFLWDAC